MSRSARRSPSWSIFSAHRVEVALETAALARRRRTVRVRGHGRGQGSRCDRLADDRGRHRRAHRHLRRHPARSVGRRAFGAAQARNLCHCGNGRRRRLHALRSGRCRALARGNGRFPGGLCHSRRRPRATAGPFRPTRAGRVDGPRTFREGKGPLQQPDLLRLFPQILPWPRADLLDDEAGGERARAGRNRQGCGPVCSRTGSRRRRDRRRPVVSTSLSISIAATTSAWSPETITEPLSERVTAASLQSLRISSSAVSNDAVWYSDFSSLSLAKTMSTVPDRIRSRNSSR